MTRVPFKRLDTRAAFERFEQGQFERDYARFMREQEAGDELRDFLADAQVDEPYDPESQAFSRRHPKRSHR